MDENTTGKNDGIRNPITETGQSFGGERPKARGFADKLKETLPGHRRISQLQEENTQLQAENDRLRAELLALQLRNPIVGTVDPGLPPGMPDPDDEQAMLDAAEKKGREQAEAQDAKHRFEQKSQEAKERFEKEIAEFKSDIRVMGGEVGIGFAAIPATLDATQIKKRFLKKPVGYWTSAQPKKVGDSLLSYKSKITFKKTTTKSGLEDVEVYGVDSTPSIEGKPNVRLPEIHLECDNVRDSRGNNTPSVRKIELLWPKLAWDQQHKRPEHDQVTQNMRELLGADHPLVKFISLMDIDEFNIGSDMNGCRLEVSSSTDKVFKAKLDTGHRIKRDPLYAEPVVYVGTSYAFDEIGKTTMDQPDRFDWFHYMDPAEFMQVSRSFLEAIEVLTPFTYSQETAGRFTPTPQK